MAQAALQGFVASVQDLACIRHACHQWQGLLRGLAAGFRTQAGQTLGRYLVEIADEHLGKDYVHRYKAPAPQTGFYFCSPCVGRQEPGGSLKQLLAGKDHAADYQPIFEYQGMPGPPCKLDGRRAVWICHKGFAVLAEAVGIGELPKQHLPEDYLPEAVSAIIDWTGERSARAAPRESVLLPYVAVIHTIQFWCPSCPQKISRPHADLGQVIACPGCKQPVEVRGPSSPQFKLRGRCPACKTCLAISPRHIRAAVRCQKCKNRVHVAAHQIAELGSAGELAEEEEPQAVPERRRGRRTGPTG